MGRITRVQKSKKSETDDIDDDISSVGTGSDIKVPGRAKKLSSRLQEKVNEENAEAEKQKNGKASHKRKKNDIESTEDKSDVESDTSANKKAKETQDKDDDSNESDLDNDKSQNKKTKGKEINEKEKTTAKPASKAGKTQKKNQSIKKEDSEEEYEVAKIVNQRIIKGHRQFLVRWKGYTEESDTWENEKELNCDRLIEEFLAEQEDESADQEPQKKGKQARNAKNKNSKKGSKSSNGKDDGNESGDSDDSTEYEVEKIIEVHFKKDKTREFLIRWKGFSSKSDTWEPEEHLNCPELINKFMEKLEKIKNVDSRELRTNPIHTNRFTLTMHADKRQSRRNANKQRKTYYED